MIQRIWNSLPRSIRSSNRDACEGDDFWRGYGVSSEIPIRLTNILCCLKPLFFVDFVGFSNFLGLLLNSLLGLEGSAYVYQADM